MRIGECHNSRDSTSPGLGSKTVTPSDTATDEIWPGEVARQLVVFSAGDVCFVGIDGETDTWTFTEDMSYPQTIDVFVKRVKATGTDVTAGDIKAIR
jgi:hypothetical protein